MYCDENRWRFFCLLRIISESGVYQLGVPQGQGDSSAPSTSDPLICGFCLVTTPNTRGKTVEQSIVTWMFAQEFITNRHPVVPQLTNKPCTNWRLREKHKCIVMRTDGQTDWRTEMFYMWWLTETILSSTKIFLEISIHTYINSYHNYIH